MPKQPIIAEIKATPNNAKKFQVILTYPSGRTKSVRFGAQGYEDYTIHKDKERLDKYLSRHGASKSKQNWGISGIETAGFWSRWLLWSKPSIGASIKHINEKFKGIKARKVK